MKIFRLLLGVLLAGALVSAVAAQKFPTKPITLVVPYPAGGNVDTSARILQAAIGKALGVPIIVENRPGAAGFIAGDYVARAQPDGHTLFVTSNGPLLLAPLVMPKPPYSWDSAFAPVSMLTIGANVLLVRPSLPVHSVKELVDYAKQNRDKFQVAVDTGASINNFLSELLKQHAGIDWVAVRYRGNVPALTDLIAGHVDAGFAQLLESIQHIRSGQLRALAVMVKERVPALPDVPTMAEAGYPGVEGIIFTGVLAPKGTPPETIDILNAAIRTALAQPAVIKQFADLGADARSSTPAAFAEFLRVENAKWTEVAKKSNLKVSE